ncbi:MAG: DNA mismatch repair protein MutS [Syntrophobacterales bacterium CG_4_8_14_3_um_filter_49_14]|nr:MAG: DNA mismatch repair protein MutS [Syntrophobacterales bacterium CG23_combo_of_CG06-09_8_20_14_all_48_27]PJC74206.1 MAG: DNA mismatch repair protein MutS [Syntrophobacterales bacterium CG_4_8_14_3_um_filter_49_14]
MNLTPAMKQYVEIKEQHKDCILLFRMGDFYEMFFEDAITAAKVLDITLTSRNKGKEDSVPLCGFPYHAAPAYIAKLIERGFKVAICEQMEDPKDAQGIVKRDVVRIVTPGLVVDADNLEAGENNFLAALTIGGTDGAFGLAFLDISTGEFRVTESSNREFFLAEVSGLGFREVIVQEDRREDSFLRAFSQGTGRCRINYFSADYFDHDAALTRLQQYFTGDQLKQIEVERHPTMVTAAGAILRYVEETQKNTPRHINDIQRYETDGYLILDETAKRNLELFTTIADGGKQGTLFHVLDETVTSMGARRLRWWLNYPLVVPEKIRERLSAVSEIREHHLLRENLRRSLGRVYDLERLGGRISLGVANGRDMIALLASLQALPEIRSALHELRSSLIVSICAGIDEMPDILELIERSIVEDPPLTLREGGIIKEGYDRELDELISVMQDGKRWIAALEEKERKRTGINSLKVGFNSVFGYYIEVTRTNTGLVPDDYVRKQTLVNAERYINQELKEYEYTVLNAENLRKEREYNLFVMIRDQVGQEIRRVQTTALRIADLDAISSLAEVAEKYNYTCPTVDGRDRVVIGDGRHPVVERMPLPDGFVPNDVCLDLDKNRLLIITGPNMAGKSTYIRQVALIVLLAQMGSFVPATKAHIGVVDRIFTRIGAADSLARGQSTFMVEMNEVAGILKSATPRSLIILDEVGRGTSTFDGLSIAWAVAEYIHDAKHLRTRTLFATHYHQLTDLAITKDGVKNFNIAVKEWGNSIIFLRKIVEGGTNRSYGIAVARIAGVPEEVILRAREILNNLEKGELDEVGMPKIARGKKTTGKDKRQLNLFMDDEELIIAELKCLNITNMTPLDTLNLVSKWKDKLGKGKK